MRFKVDENVPLELVQRLRSRGHDAEHALDEGLGGQPDGVLAAACRREERAIVTLDLDFADVRRFPPSEHAGLIVLRPRLQDRSRILRMVDRLLDRLGEERVAGRLWVVDETSVRLRE